MYQVEWQTGFCQQLKATVIDIVVCNVNLTTGDNCKSLRQTWQAIVNVAALGIKKAEENGEKRTMS